jgi:hypothetical protein
MGGLRSELARLGLSAVVEPLGGGHVRVRGRAVQVAGDASELRAALALLDPATDPIDAWLLLCEAGRP